MLYFLQTNNIKDMAGLEEKVEDMYGAQRGIAEELKPIDRRLKTLDEHISNAEKYFQYRDIYRQYKQQKPKKQKAYSKSSINVGVSMSIPAVSYIDAGVQNI